jgi:hypothetical protein
LSGADPPFIARIAVDAASAGVRELRGEYLRSAKNAQVADFYPRHGFFPAGEPEDGPTLWRRSVDARPPLRTPAWIALV